MTVELAEDFLKTAEELLDANAPEEHMLEALVQAEEVANSEPSVLCKSARLLFRYGILNSKGRFFLLALDKLKQAEEISPHFFETSATWLQLWGNILVQLGGLLKELSFFEQALDKFSRASKKGHHSSLYWDWGEAWIFIAEHSGEISDYRQGLLKFLVAKKIGVASPFFYLDYAHALSKFAELTGDPSHLEEGACYLKNIISDAAYTGKEENIGYIFAWRKLALMMKVRFELTHDFDHFVEADTIFRDAILASPRNGELWLDWGDLFLQAGWIKQDIKLVEEGLEKLTASKIKECDPARTYYLLGRGLVYFGLFIENLKVIKDGQNRIQNAITVGNPSAQFERARLFAELALSLYFSDIGNYIHLSQEFEKAIQSDASCVENWHILFQIYMTWGIKIQDPQLIKRGVAAIGRVCELRPFSHMYLNEWGVALLRLRQLEVSDEILAQGYAEEALLIFKKAYELCEDDETLYNMACALDVLGDLTADVEHYLKALELLSELLEEKPYALHIRCRLGLVYSHLGELTESADCFHQAIDLLEVVAKNDQEDDNLWCAIGLARLELAELMTDTFKTQERDDLRGGAEKALLRSAELGNPEACYYLACLYSLAGYLEASICYLKKAEKCEDFPSREDLEQEEWLANVRETDGYHDLLTMWEKDG